MSRSLLQDLTTSAYDLAAFCSFPPEIGFASGVASTGILIYSPIELGGLGLQRTEVNQTIDHVKMIIQHGHTESIIGKLIRNTLEQLSIEAGLSEGPFQLDLTEVNYLTEIN